MPDRVYLDWNATTPLRPEARQAMAAAWDLVGNPSSVHAEGRHARRLVEDARSVIAAFSTGVMNVTPRTFVVQRTAYASCRPSAQTIAGYVTSNHAADVWTFTPESRLTPGDYCVSIAADVYDLTARVGDAQILPWTINMLDSDASAVDVEADDTDGEEADGDHWQFGV